MAGSHDISPVPEWRLHFLAWVDAIEKLDILVLELRHLQQTCIYGLRLPELYELLLREEVLLDPRTFEGLWNDLTADGRFLEPEGDTLAQARRLAEDHVWLYPEIKDPVVTDPVDQRAKVIAGIHQRVRNRWRHSLWSDARKDHYDVLTVAQRLKQQIVADRLFLFLEGRRALFRGAGQAELNLAIEGARLFTLRMGILSRCHSYLDRVGDLQQRLAQHIEAMPPEYPRPNVQRRRVQGVYTHYLIDHVKYIRQSMNLLLKDLRGDADVKPCPPILHRWLHAYSSSQGAFLGEVDGHADGGRGPDDGRQADEVDFVRTGFWMPDKPDNQPILAHELAHHAIRQHYENLLPQALGAAPRGDCFASLMREITEALKTYAIPMPDGDPIRDATAAIDPKEIACDLLAAGTKGVSYLYAFFLEAAGWGLEHTLVDQHGYLPHLSVRLELHDRLNGIFARDLRDWYVRGRILVAWLRATNNQNTGVDRWVLDGVEGVLEQLNSYLDGIIPNAEYRSGVYWKRLTDRLCLLAETSRAARRTASWRKRRRDQGQRESLGQAGYSEPGEFPRFAAPLPERLRSVFNFYVEMARSRGADPTDSRIPEDARGQLFKHAFDIPWQCALIRAGDFFHDYQGPVVRGSRGKPATSALYYEISTDTSFGRRFFFLAVEIDYTLGQAPCERLRTLIRLLDAARESDTKWVKDAEGLLDDELEEQRKGGATSAIREIQWEQGQHIDQFLREHLGAVEGSQPTVLTDMACDIMPYLAIHAPYGSLSSSGEAPALYADLRRELESHRAHRLRSGGGGRRYGEQLWDLFDVRGVGDTFGNGATGGSEAASGDGYILELLLASRIVVAKPQLVEGVSATVDRRSAAFCAKNVRISVLGDFRELMLREDHRPICRCPTPLLPAPVGKSPRAAALQTGADQRERYLPIISRRETWLRTRVTQAPPDGSKPLSAMNPFTKDTRLPERTIGLLFLQLNRRFTRLDFLYWILHWGRLPEQFGLSTGDDVFLTDGWADIVFVLSDRTTWRGETGTDGTAPRYCSDLFDLQARVHDNFMVSRTELSPTVHCLQKLNSAEASTGEQFVLYALIRLDECRVVEPMFWDIRQILGRALKEKGFMAGDVRMLRTPGRNDLSLVLTKPTEPRFHQFRDTLESDELQKVIDGYDLYLARKDEIPFLGNPVEHEGS